MSFEDGWAALHLNTPPRVPRTEYSAEGHWDLIKAVTGVDVDQNSPFERLALGSDAFVRAWNYDFFWSVLIGASEFGDKCTKMGHAEYAAGGTDRDDDIHEFISDPEDALRLDPMEVYGRKKQSELVERFEHHYRLNCCGRPTGVNMTGVYVTLISGLIDIFGWDVLLMAAGLDAKGFGDLANRYAAWMQQYFDAMAASNVPVIMVHDDIVWTSGAIFAPDWYRTYVFPNYKKYFRPLIDAGKKIIYTSDGTYTEFIDDIADCGVHGFVMEPTTDMACIAEKYGKSHVFIGNADTRILLTGTKPQIRAEVERCIAIGKDCPGYFMAVGNHIPANTPVENAVYYNEVYQQLSRR